MRVVVACDAIGTMRATPAGRALARAWRDAGAQVALIPMAATGPALLTALADAGAAVVTHSPDAGRTSELLLVVPPAITQEAWTGSSAPVGTALASELVDPRPLVAVDLTTVPAHDGGAGLLAALGATADVDLTRGWSGLTDLGRLDLTAGSALLGGRELVGLVDPADLTVPLTSLRGVSSVRGREAGLDLAEIVAADRALGTLATHAGIDGVLPGPGAAGGTGLAVLALGGSLSTVPAFAARIARLDEALTRADLVVSTCGSLDMGSYGGPVVRQLADLAGEHGVPLVVGAGQVEIGGREMRAQGIEAAYVLDPTTADSLTGSAAGMVRTWTW